MSDTYNDKIWLQHDNEPDLVYMFFARHFLTARSPTDRNVLSSYRRYLRDEVGKPQEYVDGIKNVPQKWFRWAKGIDEDGNVVVGLDTWEDRANAYWSWIFEDELNKIMDRRGKVIEHEYSQGNELLNLWQQMFDNFKSYAANEMTEAKKAKIKLDTSGLFRKFKDILKTRDDLSVFIRRSVGLTDSIKEDVYANAFINSDIEIEWVLPEGKKYEETKEDIELQNMSEAEFEKLLDRLSS